MSINSQTNPLRVINTPNIVPSITSEPSPLCRAAQIPSIPLEQLFGSLSLHDQNAVFSEPLVKIKSTKKQSKNNAPPIQTAKITKKVNRSFLHSVAESWRDLAIKRESATFDEPVHTISPAQRDMAEASIHITDALTRHLDQNTSEVPYVAYDTTHQAQAVALVSFPEDKTPSLSLIATHPNNIMLSSNGARPCRGAGTALLSHITHDIMKREAFEDFSVEALNGAVPFYKKFGFENSRRGISSPETTALVLPARNMQRILKKFEKQSRRVTEQQFEHDVRHS